MLEAEAIGGQAGTSSLIRNYLGFPRGLSGAELATRAFQQAWLFGATPNVTRPAVALRPGDHGGYVVTLSGGDEVATRSVILATGITYRKLEIESLDRLIGIGVYYGAATTEARAMEGHHVYVVGGANSAGQAAVYLAEYAKQVTMLVRGGSLAATMSDYLIKAVAATPNIDVRYEVEVIDGAGAPALESITLRHVPSGTTEPIAATALFVLIGGEPRTAWLPDEILRDDWGYILTGNDLVRSGRPLGGWTLERPPMMLETSLPGVFAAGDARSRSIKRVAAAVGEGSTVVSLVHEYLDGLD
jgi:thioredoxin reductase (NADPH)